MAACACPGVLSSALGPACGAGRARSSSPPTPRRCARRLEYFWVWSTCNRNVLRMDPRSKESYMLKTSTLRSDHIKAIFTPHNVLLQIASQQVFMQYREDASNLLPLQATGAHSRQRPCCTLECLWQWKSQPDCQGTQSRPILQDVWHPTRKERCLSMATFLRASSWLCRLYTITRSAFFQKCITCMRWSMSAHKSGTLT